MSTETKEETFTLEEILTSLKTSHRLILWNDDVNTFDHVIYSFPGYQIQVVISHISALINSS